MAKNTQTKQVVEEPTLPANAVALMDGTRDTLTTGKLYAIKDPTKFSDDPQLILTEDIFRSSVPDGFYTVQAVGPRHFIPHHYEPLLDVEPGEITGFCPEFNVTEDLEPNPVRARQAAALGNPKNRLIQNRAQVLHRENRVAAKAFAPGNAQPGTSLLPNSDEDVPDTLD